MMTEADADLLERLRRTDTYTLADAARRHGVGGVIDSLRPLTAASAFAGRALTARLEYDPAKTIPLKEYGIGSLLDRVQPGDAVILDGGALPLTAMGDLAMAMLKRRGAVGAIVNARVRDLEEIETMGFPVFALAAGITTLAGNARIVGIGEPVEIGGIRVGTGDFIAGCRGGLLAVPWAQVGGIADHAERVTESDRQVLRGIQAGEELSELWRRYKNLD